MTWDETKQTLNDRPDIVSERKLTSADWNDMVADQKDHKTRHEDGGVDELNVQGLSGLLADPQTPDTEDVQDIVGAFTEAATGSNISVDYDDANDTLTIDTTALNPEETRDTVNDLLVGGANTTLTYDDGNDTLTIDVDAPTTAEFEDHSTRHESGGSDEIGLNNLDLSTGAQIDEDGGDLVIRDSGGSIVLRRDEGAGTWDFVSGDLTGIASLEAEYLSIDTRQLFISDSEPSDLDEGDAWINTGSPETGSSAFLANRHQITDGQFDRVKFDSTIYNHRGEFDVNNHEFVAAHDGLYHITTQVRDRNFADSDGVPFFLRLNYGDDEVVAKDNEATNGDSLNISRTVELEEGDVVFVEARQDSGSDGSIEEEGDKVYLTVNQIA